MLPRLLVTLVLLAPVASLAGCGDPDAPPDGAKEVGSRVARWSQGDHDRLSERYGDRSDGTVTTDAEREELLAALPDGRESAAVRAVDLEADLLVVGSYGRCMERSRVLAEDDEVWLDVHVPEEDRQTSCGWAPLQVEVWEVSREDV